MSNSPNGDETPNLPMNWESELAKHAKEVSSLERPSVSRLSFKSGVISFMNQPVPNNELEVVIIGAMFEKRWYKGRYDPNKPAAPHCFAFSMDSDQDMVPHPDAFEVQSRTCDTCPLNEWASDRNGGKGKECKETRKLAVLAAGDITDAKHILEAEVAIADIPVTSVENWRGYVQKVAAATKRPWWAVRTKMFLKPHPKSQFKVHFECTGLIDNSLIEAVFQRTEQAPDILQIPYVRTSDGNLSPQTEAMMTGRKY